MAQTKKIEKSPTKSTLKKIPSKKSSLKVLKSIHEWTGKLLHTTWGQDQGIMVNDFCQIIEVSSTRKTIKCRMVIKTTNGLEYGPHNAGRVKAGNTTYGPEFRLKVTSDGFYGSYPYIIGKTKEESEYRKGNFIFSEPTIEHFENHRMKG